MRLRHAVGACFLAALVWASPPADAGPCAGFEDVSDFDTFCKYVVWLKNRQVTLGCDGTHYCPDDAVSRLSMAAFMNRVGTAMTPRVFSVEQTGGTLDLNLRHILCQSGTFPARTHRRTVVASATLSFDLTGLQDVGLQLVESQDGGMTWTMPFGASADFNVRSRGDTGVRHNAHTHIYGILDGHPAITRRYALEVTNAGTPVTSAISGGWTCHLHVSTTNAVETP